MVDWQEQECPPFGCVFVLARLQIGKNAIEIETKTSGVLFANRSYFVDDAISHLHLPSAREQGQVFSFARPMISQPVISSRLSMRSIRALI